MTSRLAGTAAAPLSPTLRGMLWMFACGLQFTMMNALLKTLSQQMDAWMAGWIRYTLGILFLLPSVLHAGWQALRPKQFGLHFLRGAFHAGGILLWLTALPHIMLAELTAISFMSPIYICLGAVLFLGERMSAARWLAVLLGFGGVLLVVRPWETGFSGVSKGTFFMLLSTPVFAVGFLLAKLLTRTEKSATIVLWQHLWVALLLFPFALPGWTIPGAQQWGIILLAALLGTGGHYCNTRSYAAADISAVQSIKFLELVWASLLGLALFDVMPAGWTMLGGMVILGSTLWIARRESRGT